MDDFVDNHLYHSTEHHCSRLKWPTMILLTGVIGLSIGVAVFLITYLAHFLLKYNIALAVYGEFCCYFEPCVGSRKSNHWHSWGSVFLPVGSYDGLCDNKHLALRRFFAASPCVCGGFIPLQRLCDRCAHLVILRKLNSFLVFSAEQRVWASRAQV